MAKNNILKITTKVDSCLRVSIWAGKLVTRRITVRACTRVMSFATDFLSSEIK